MALLNMHALHHWPSPLSLVESSNYLLCHKEPARSSPPVRSQIWQLRQQKISRIVEKNKIIIIFQQKYFVNYQAKIFCMPALLTTARYCGQEPELSLILVARFEKYFPFVGKDLFLVPFKWCLAYHWSLQIYGRYGGSDILGDWTNISCKTLSIF